MKVFTLVLAILLMICACYDVFGQRNNLEAFCNPKDREDNGFDSCLNFAFNHVLFDIGDSNNNNFGGFTSGGSTRGGGAGRR